MRGKPVASYALTRSPVDETIFSPVTTSRFIHAIADSIDDSLGYDSKKIKIRNLISVSSKLIALMDTDNRIYVADMSDVYHPKHITSLIATDITNRYFTNTTHFLNVQSDDSYFFTADMVYAVNHSQYLGSATQHTSDIKKENIYGYIETALFANRYLFIDDSHHNSHRSVRIQKIPCIEKRIRTCVITELRGLQIIADALLDSVADYLDNDVYSKNRFFKAPPLSEVGEQTYPEDKLLLKKHSR